MIAVLRDEEQHDIDHRDRCERAQGKNSNDMQDLNASIDATSTRIEDLQEEERHLENDIAALDNHIEHTTNEMKEALDLRNDAVSEFKQAVKDDTDAVALLDRTIIALSEFYRKNRIPMSLSQRAPEYSVDKDKAPELSWADEKYGGRSDETHGIVAILQMLKEDVQKEIETSRADNAAAEAQYEKERADLQDTLNAQRSMKAATERRLGEVQEALQDKTKSKGKLESDLAGEAQLESSLYDDCAWVATHFDSRREKRQAEIDGLIEAKGYLAGAETDSLI